MQLARSLARLGASCLIALTPSMAIAGPTPPDAGERLPLLETSEQSLDPIGLDDSTGRELDRAAARLDEARKRAQAVVQKPSAVRGEVLTSLDAVQELSHRVEVKLAQGLAFVTLELVFASRAKVPAELAYRLPLPEDGALYALKVCRLVEATKNSKAETAPAPHCVRASPRASDAGMGGSGSTGDGLSASAHVIHDARGRALSLHASALDMSALLSLSLAYVAPAPLHGGVVRFHLPARGYDPHIAPTELSLQASGFTQLTPGAAATLDAHLPYELRAELGAKPAAAKPVTIIGQCGGKACARSYQAAPAGAPVTRPTWLLLDTSPSMEGPARNAADLTLASLLTELPEATPLRVFAFAAHSQELGSFRPDAAPLKKLSDALMTDLGASTNPARVLELHKAELFAERPRVLLLSDGKLDRSALSALSGFSQRGVELWLMALGNVKSELGAAFTAVVQAGHVEGDALDERLRAALSPRAANGLAAGEERVHERAPKQRYTPRATENWLSYWLARRDPARFATPDAGNPSAVAAPSYESVAPAAAPADTGMPKESVLSMLRSQLVPEARACLRADRKGRANYAVSLTFQALFAEREVYDVRVEGRIPDALRSCLGEVVARLRIPAFSGRIRVRYPIHTEREPEAPVIELEPDALEQVERVISGK